MAIRTIVRLGHPALRTPAEALPPEQLEDPEIQTLIDDMLETMRAAEGVGLAAPQLGLELRLVVYAAVDPDRPDEKEPRLEVLVNPGIEPESGDVVYDWEGCLSIPDLRGLVPRYPAVRVHALDRHGKRLDFRAEGYEARIVQHEFDHLEGIVFLDRMRDLRSLCFAEEWQKYMIQSDDEGSAVG
ncbi:MAG: peptide deformylase [Holophagales bacterium]|nr:peptide deformylase [Holophagales bacterium]